MKVKKVPWDHSSGVVGDLPNLNSKLVVLGIMRTMIATLACLRIDGEVIRFGSASMHRRETKALVAIPRPPMSEKREENGNKRLASEPVEYYEMVKRFPCSKLIHPFCPHSCIGAYLLMFRGSLNLIYSYFSRCLP